MDDIRAAIGVVQLDKLKADIEKRAQVRKWYLDALKDNHNIIIPFAQHQGFVSNYVFPIVVKGANRDQRDALRNHIHERGVQTSVHYPAVHRFSSFKDYYVDLPFTDQYVESTLTLPMYAKLELESVEAIVMSMEVNN
jgi:dTDP-4-amino-4,6-dideoxygalactose transaminase